jgi:hypothetical protein
MKHPLGRFLWFGAWFSLVFPVVGFAQPGTFQLVTPSSFGTLELEHGNGNKIVRGPMNLMHVVYNPGSAVVYRASASGVSWTSPLSLGPGRLPAIAVDHLSQVGVVFVRNGAIHYGYKTLSQPSFTVASLNQAGTEPAIVANGNRVYLSWTTGTEVRYTSFPTLAPPVVASFETIASTWCPNTLFSKTSITLVGDLCTKAVWPVVGYLTVADDWGSPPPCNLPFGYVGVRVAERQPANSWVHVFTDVQFGGAPMRALSLSISATTFLQEVFVAWSDELPGPSPRSRLAKGNFGTYSAVTVAPTPSHLHVRAANDHLFPFGRFRLTRVDEHVFVNNPFQNFNGWLNEGIWTTGPSPTWNPINHNLAAGSGVPGRSQAFYWETLTPARQRRQFTSFYERREWLSPQGEKIGLYRAPDEPWLRRMGIDCILPNGDDNPINVAARTVRGEGGETSETWVDFGETGRVVDVFDTGLEIQLLAGGTVQVTWPESATMLSAFEDGFVVAAAPTDLSFTSDDASFEVVDQGPLPEDPVFTTLTCNAELGECPEGF